MFIIQAHGVKNVHSHFSYAQNQLINNPAPIRICGAPTGAGKTYAFFEIVKRRQLVFFIVPTQALAEDIKRQAMSLSLPVEIWDYQQTQASLKKEIPPWIDRKEKLDELANGGGMIVATLEALARLTVGLQPKQQFAPTDIRDLLWKAQHIVFDEVHTLTERAFGLVHLMILLIADMNAKNPTQAPKLSLLSATHSNLFEELLEKESFLAGMVAVFDEEVVQQDFDRVIHGEVTVAFHDTSLLAVVEECAPLWLGNLAEGTALLLVYDSLWQFVNDEAKLAQLFDANGLQRNEVIVINGLDKQAPSSAGSSGFDAGRVPVARHRVIIGTSAVEMGVNFRVNTAVLEAGRDGAALLQRIGRVARNVHEGQVLVCRSSIHQKTDPPHLQTLMKLNATSQRYTIEEVRREFQPLREVNLTAAKYLGRAYWSMLSRLNSHLMYDHVLPVFREFSGETDSPLGILPRLHRLVKTNDWMNKRHLKKWLIEIDRTLQDVRGFAPTLRVQFQGRLGEYSEDWLLSKVELEVARYEEETGVYVFEGPRDAYLREKSIDIQVTFFSPIGALVTIWARTVEEARNLFIKGLASKKGKCRDPGFEEALLFMQMTRLVARDGKVDSVEATGGIV